MEYDLKSSLPITERAPAQSSAYWRPQHIDLLPQHYNLCLERARDRSRSIIVPKISLHKANISSSIARFLA